MLSRRKFLKYIGLTTASLSFPGLFGCSTIPLVRNVKNSPNSSLLDKIVRVSADEAMNIKLAYSKEPTKYYNNMVPVVFTELEHQNEKLANELGKIDDFQNGINSKQVSGLVKLLDVFSKEKENITLALDNWISVGYSNHTTYLPELQAMFWLAEDGRSHDVKQILKDYGEGNLKKQAMSNRWSKWSEYEWGALLESAWPLNNFQYISKFKWKKSESKKLEACCINQETKKKIKDFRMENGSSLEYVLDLYNSFPQDFTCHHSEQDFLKLLNEQTKKWDNFNTVVRRLSHPGVIQYAVFGMFNQIPDIGNDYAQNPRQTFKRGGGDCEDWSIFAAYCAEMGGWKTRVCGGNPHVVGAFQGKDKKYYLFADTRGSAGGKIKGPYNSFDEIAYGAGPVATFNETWSGAISLINNNF